MITKLFERDDALALLASEAARATAGSGRLLLFRGPTGAGRSALLQAAAEHGAELGMRVLEVRCSAADPGIAFAPVRQLLDPPDDFGPDDDPPDTPHHLGYPARLWRLMCSYAEESPLLLAVDDVHLADPDSRRWLAEAARRISGVPVLLVVTERGQYDIAPPTPGLAHGLSPVLVRVHASAPLGRDAAAAEVREVFGADAAEPWVDGCVRAAAGIPLLLRALLDDLRAVVPDGGAPGVALPESCADLYPGAFAAAVSWWLGCAGTGTTAVARALAELECAEGAGEEGPGSALSLPDPLAALSSPPSPPSSGAPASSGAPTAPGPPSSPSLPSSSYGESGFAGHELLAEASGADPARVAGWITAMIRLGPLRRHPGDGRPRFAHPLLREAVLDGWPQSERQATHRAAAEFRHRRGDRAEAVAGHLLRTPPTGVPWAARTLTEAAASASRAGRAVDAAGYLRRALDEPMEREHRAWVLTELGSLEFATARSAGIPRLTEALHLLELPRDRAMPAVTLATALAHRGEARAAFDVLRDLGGLPDDPVLARTVQTASALLSDQDSAIRRDVYAGLRDTERRSPDLFSPAVRVLLVRYEASAGLVSAAGAMKRIRELLAAREEPPLMPYLLVTAATVAQWADALDDADRLVRTGLTEYRLSPLHPAHRALLNVRMDTAAARGKDERVLTWGATAAAGAGGGAAGVVGAAAGAVGSGVGFVGASNPLAHVVMALVRADRGPEAERLVAGVNVEDAHDGWEVNRYLYARGVLRAAVGDRSGALNDFLECGRRQNTRDVVSPVVTPWRSAAAECHLALGRPEEALLLAEEEYRFAAVWGTPRVLGRALRVLGAATGGRRGLELTGGAVDSLRNSVRAGGAGGGLRGSLVGGLADAGGSGLDTELVAALITHGRQLIAARQSRQARPLLREAAALAERIGAVHLRTAAEQALRAGGARRGDTRLTGTGALTGSERRIAALAADGRTNAEISELLHLALRTVETHLTSTYRKLGIRRRADLPAALAVGGGSGEGTTFE
ncbi:AAA family ATPase [Streptomyces sp. NPDC087658]|uniref:helix-turn-helix transcriptional regulator n=1 Tax=Streptomyces sp. NPDC087658 TaxID=3365800 RepID=UPI00380198B8